MNAVQHVINVSDLSVFKVQQLIQRAIALKHQSYPKRIDANVLMAFYENSTRTRLSFELASRQLGCHIFNFDPSTSSDSKGEVIEDLMQTMIAMGIDLMVIRHPDADSVQSLAETFGERICIVNAGAGMNAHPTQALLDMMTLIDRGLTPSRVKMAIVGDVRHSRVAQSMMRLAQMLGVRELVMCAPQPWLPESVCYGTLTDDLKSALEDADVVMTLRVQNERLEKSEVLDEAKYKCQYSITQQSLAWAKPETWVMHPGPMNRGVEISSEVADGPRSLVFDQVKNGVFMRMAILESCLESEHYPKLS